MFKNGPITFPEKSDKWSDLSDNNVPAQKLSSQAACYKSNIIEVSVSNKVSEHSQKEANLFRIDICFVNVGMDEVRKAKKSIEWITKW